MAHHSSIKTRLNMELPWMTKLSVYGSLVKLFACLELAGISFGRWGRGGCYLGYGWLWLNSSQTMSKMEVGEFFRSVLFWRLLSLGLKRWCSRWLSHTPTERLSIVYKLGASGQALCIKPIICISGIITHLFRKTKLLKNKSRMLN